MAHEITADFEKVYQEGPSIRVALRLPIGRPHVTVLFGPSGSGKTTVLRCLAGLERPRRGSISFDGEIWFDADTNVMMPPQQRGVGYLFQDYALFPHLTVSGNIGYALSRMNAGARASRIRELLKLLRLEGLENRRPGQLSGGQQQRVALARVLAPRPRLLLLDEPLSALDAPTRESLRSELRTLLRIQETPALCVTHDWVEALTLADEVAIVADGRILQTGAPEDVFSRPSNAEAAAIVGVETVVAARVVERADDLVGLEVGSARLWALESGPSAEHYYLSIRAEDVTIEMGTPPSSSARNHLSARVAEIHPAGPLSHVVLDCGFRLVALVTRQAALGLGLRPGMSVTATIKASAIHLIPR
jgi:molybdate transport system ATP-binding protein